MLLTGEMINAKTAAEIGLINRCVNYKELTSVTIDLANTIVSKSNTTISVGKKTFHKQYEMNLSDAYKYCSQVMVDNLMHRDAITGIKDFLKKKLIKNMKISAILDNPHSVMVFRNFILQRISEYPDEHLFLNIVCPSSLDLSMLEKFRFNVINYKRDVKGIVQLYNFLKIALNFYY